MGGIAGCGPEAIEIATDLGSTLYPEGDRDALPAENLATSLNCDNPTRRPPRRRMRPGLSFGVSLAARCGDPTGKPYGLGSTKEMLALVIENQQRAGATTMPARISAAIRPNSSPLGRSPWSAHRSRRPRTPRRRSGAPDTAPRAILCCPPRWPSRFRGRVPRAPSDVHSTPAISSRVKNCSVTPSGRCSASAFQAFGVALYGRSPGYANEGVPNRLPGSGESREATLCSWPQCIAARHRARP